MHLKMTSGKWRQFCLGLNILYLNQVIVSYETIAAWSSSCTIWNVWHHTAEGIWLEVCLLPHYSGVIVSAMVSQITVISIVYLTVFSGVVQKKYQSSASVAVVRGNPRTEPVTRKKVSIWWRHHVVTSLKTHVFRLSMLDNARVMSAMSAHVGPMNLAIGGVQDDNCNRCKQVLNKSSHKPCAHFTTSRERHTIS